ncbi:MAG: hypothetical protein RLZZ15_3079, partial [Verrucomicrobiota bacterium]
MNRSLATVALALFSLCPLVGRGAPADDVAAIFSKHCIDCHSLAKGRTEKNLDLTNLVAVASSRRLVNPGDPAASKLMQKIADDAMPPDDEEPRKPPLNAQQKAAILSWIKAGAPPPAGSVDTSGRFLSTRTLLRELFQDLLEIDELDRPFIRYLTLATQYNAGDTDAKLETYRKGVRKLLNSLSRKPRIARIAHTGTGGTLLRFDLRALGWTAFEWDYLVSRYPYGV